MTLFNREMILTIGSIIIKTKSSEFEPMLKAEINVVLSSGKDPNSANVTIYNLSDKTRKELQKEKIKLLIEVGYVNNISKIFEGDITFSQSKYTETEWITSVQCGDGVQKFKSARINKSFKGPIKVGEVLKEAAKELGFNIDSIQEQIKNGSIRGALTEFANGIVLSGKGEQQLDKILKSMGYSWSIQSGQLQLLGPKDTVNNDAILLNHETGMIGSPEIGEKGFIKVRSLIQPNLLPGNKIKIESKNNEIDGFFRVEKSTFSCDTWGDNWYVDLEAKSL